MFDELMRPLTDDHRAILRLSLYDSARAAENMREPDLALALRMIADVLRTGRDAFSPWFAELDMAKQERIRVAVPRIIGRILEKEKGPAGRR